MKKERNYGDKRSKQEIQQRVISRSSFLKLAGLTAAATAGVLILKELASNNSSAENYPNLIEYYPELKGYSVKQEFEFQTGGTKTEVYNLTNAEIDEKILTEFYITFARLAPQQGEATTSYLDTNLSISRRDRLLQRTLIFIPQSAPLPAWGPSPYAATTFDLDPERPVTYIRVPDSNGDIAADAMFQDETLETNILFMVEACQSTLYIDDLGHKYSQRGVQEVFCNSTGYMFLVRQTERNYSEYENLFRGRFVTGPNFRLPVYGIDESSYEQIPLIGLPIKIG